MRSRTLLWLGLGLVAAGLVSLLIGAVTGSFGPFGPGWMIGALRGPGTPGFVAGTRSAPRLVEIVAMPQLRFAPEAVVVQRGETVTFRVSTMGPLTHEFMVGPAADVADDKPGTPEIADIGMMETRSLTYTFDGPGPYAFACHAPGHYEAGMAGTITVVP
jgi:plastocyanin